MAPPSMLLKTSYWHSLPNLVHHQLPPGCKDFSDYYLTTRDKPPDFFAKLPAFHSKRHGFRAKLGDLEFPGNF